MNDFDNAPFTMLALIEAGTIKESDDTLALMQNVTHGQAHEIAKWLALATDTPVHLRLMAIGAVEEIRYTPDEVRSSIKRIG